MTTNSDGKTLRTSEIMIAGCVLSALFALPFNLMPVNLGSAADTYGLNARQIGLLGSSLLAGAVAGTLIVFFSVRRFSWRTIAGIGVLLAAAGFLISPTAGGPSSLYASWFLAGVGLALPYTVAIQALTQLGNQERVMGLKLTSEVLLGAALLYLFPVFLVSRWGFGGAAIGTAASMLLGVLVLTRLPRTYLAPPQEHTGGRFEWRANLPAIIALLTLLVFFGGQTGVWAFVERIGNDIGVQPGEMGVVLAVLKLLGGAAGATAALAGARFGVRWPHVLGLACIAFGLALVHRADTVTPYAIGCWMWEFGFALSQCYQMAAVARLDVSQRVVPLIVAALAIGAALGPGIAGFLKAGESYLPIIFFTVGCAVVSTTVFSILMSPARLGRLPVSE